MIELMIATILGTVAAHVLRPTFEELVWWFFGVVSGNLIINFVVDYFWNRNSK